MKKTKSKKLLIVLLSLCTMLSLSPLTAFAGVTDVTGDNTTNPYTHTYHTKVTTTAQVIIKDADGNVVETTEVSKSGDFVEGNLGDDAVQAEIERIDDEIKTQYSSQGSITIENRNSAMVFDHFESSNIIEMTPDDKIPVGDMDALEKAASGSVKKHLDVHEYQVYQTTYDLIVQENNDLEEDRVINNADIMDVIFEYRSGDAPQATAWVLTDTSLDGCEIAYECWEEMENGEPVAFWYSDESKYKPSMKKITQFEEGKTYMYSIELREINGYTFADNCSVTINREPISATANVIKTVDGLFVMNVDSINPKPALKEIPVVEINNATLTFKDGDKPVFTGVVPDDAPYVLVFEEWRTDGEWTRSDEWFNNAEHHGNDKDITAFDKNKSYNYTFYIKTNSKAYEEGWCFGQNTKLKINGKEVSLTCDDDNEGRFSGATGITMTPTAEISVVEINNATLSYNPGDAPRATATVAAADQGKYQITDECWLELNENDVPVAIWHSNDEIYTTLPTITAFESGKKYVYSIQLMPEMEYDFGREVAATVNGNAVTAVPGTDGYLILPNVTTMIPTESDKPATIDLIEINDVTVSFKDGDKPVFTGSVPDDAAYAFRCEWWSLDSDTGIVSTEPEWGGDIYKNKITAFEAGKTYHYGVYVTAYTDDISPDAKLKINGKEVKYTRIGDESETQSFWVETDLTMTPAADGHTHSYGTDWKYDSTNHWHECSCGDKSDLTAHSFKWVTDKEATATEKGSKHEECTVCGYKKAAVDIPKIDSHNHNYGTEWKYDETNHWHECEDGEKADITAHNFKWIIDKEATATEKGSKHEECTVCGYKKTAVDIPAIGFGSSSDDEANKPTNTVSSESSSADQTNKPINTASPKTGNTDNMILWIVLLIAGGGAFITATAVDRKKK